MNAQKQQKVTGSVTGSVTVSTSRFENAHGKKPRGNGNWVFFMGNCTEVMEAFQVYGNFTAARKAAVKEAKRQNVTTVHVGS